MYVATMEYVLTPGTDPREAAAIWAGVAAEPARGREGLVRLQLLFRPGSLLAIGTWKEKIFAEAFMKTGVFITLKDRLGRFLAAEPLPRVWEEEISVT